MDRDNERCKKCIWYQDIGEETGWCNEPSRFSAAFMNWEKGECGSIIEITEITGLEIEL